MTDRNRRIVLAIAAVAAFGGCGAENDGSAADRLEEARAIIELAETQFDRTSALELSRQAGVSLTEAIDSGNLRGPERAEALRLRAATRMADREYGGAIRDLDESLGLVPDDARSIQMRADAYRLTGNADAALADLSTLIRLAPDQSVFYGERARMYFDQGRFVDAIADLTVAIDADPGAISLLELRGDAHAALGEHELALSDFRSGIDLERQLRQEMFGNAAAEGFDPAELELRVKAAEVLEESRDTAAARAEYRYVLAQDPSNEEAAAGLERLSHGSDPRPNLQP